ncbi:hypothetical protein [Kribbella pratensis]|uniref:Uncharacterized protein n=1 Tax=Kribbella pratensis TaxID=2512112 RepID=A0A4V3GG99_9ACTN|nr:hypothetical protein [Kribbella pratensis]TDW71367.1 hypothetical protein EV653_5451 [Kribbella pratensis]
MESLDEVIDAMIADRVIHRHRRIWLLVIALVVVAALIILATGGWKEKKGRTVPTLTAPTTVTAGRFEFSFTKAEIVRTPKTEYDEAESKVKIYFDAKNIDTEEHHSENPRNQLLVLVPGGGAETIESDGVSCRGEINWVLVYGLPPESCSTTFKVDPDFAAKTIEVGVLGETYEAVSGVFGASDNEFWQNEAPVAVVRLDPAVVTDNGGSK